MATTLMNEAERFLIQNWSEAHRMEEAMETVRSKYKELFEKVVERVTEDHPELERSRFYVTQFWGDGSAGFSRNAWPGNDNWPAGLWMWNLRLENLCSDTADPPKPSIWIGPKFAKAIRLDVAGARKRVREFADQALSPDERQQVVDTNLGDSLLVFEGPSKRELVEALQEDDGQRFVDLLVDRFDVMSRFVPALDELFVGQMVR